MRATVVAAAALLVAGTGGTSAQSGGLTPGDYLCKARASGGFGLTLGTASISGGQYRFSPPNGLPPVTSGSYAVSSDGSIRWSGALGAVENGQIVGSRREDAGSFSFDIRLSPGSSPTPVSCSL